MTVALTDADVALDVARMCARFLGTRDKAWPDGDGGASVLVPVSGGRTVRITVGVVDYG